MTNIKQRVKQFIAALGAALQATDHVYIQKYLSPAQAHLFYQMSLPDQYHALQVAYSARCLAATNKTGRLVQLSLLIRAALLHDIGRQKGDVTTFDKVWMVLVTSVARESTRKWALQQETVPLGRWRRALYLYYCHGEVGAKRLTVIGDEPALVALVAAHHVLPREEDSVELILLRQADELN